MTVDGDAVVVVAGDQLGQVQRASERAGFVADAFYEVTVAQKNICVTVHYAMTGWLNSFASNFSANAVSTALAILWPSGLVVASTPEVRSISEESAILLWSYRKAFSSSIGRS